MRSARRKRFILCCWAALVLCAGCSQAPPPSERAARAARIELMYADYQKEFKDVPDVTVDTLQSWRHDPDRDVVLVDGREPFEWKVSMIPGAMTLQSFKQQKEQLKDHAVVVYCTIGYRSGMQAAELREQGFDAYNLKGSILAWAHADQPVETPAGESTRRIHVYGQKWNLLPPGYTAVTEKP